MFEKNKDVGLLIEVCSTSCGHVRSLSRLTRDCINHQGEQCCEVEMSSRNRGCTANEALML
jgi:hypothetical protein